MKKLIILFLFTGCNLINPPTNVSDKLQPFVDQVVYEYNVRGVYVEPIKVVLGDLDGDKTGRYEPFPYWDKKIIIDRNNFELIVDKQPENVLKTIAHEFGHYMGRDHNNKTLDGGDPKSIMCTDCFFFYFEENYEYYFNELVGVEL